MAQPAAILSVLVTANTKPAQAQLAKFNKQLGATNAASAGAVGSMSKFAKGAGLLGVAVGGAGIVAAKAFGEFRESQKVMKQTNAVLKSTGSAAKVTADEVENLADAISLKAGMDDEAIQKAENLLLTFTKVRNETGKGNKIFNEATKVVTDMSVALDQDLKSSAIQVGKALQDPEKGITALRRVGVSFTSTQQEMITKWLEHGKVLKAQKFILAELNREFKGSAEAQADGVDKVAVAWNQLFEDLGKVIGPTIDKALTSLAKFLNQIRSGTGAGGEFAATMKDVARILQTGYEILSKYWFPVLGKLAVLWAKAFRAEVTALNWLVQRLKDVLGWLSKVANAIAAAFVSTFNRVKKVVGDVMATIFRHFAKLFDIASHLPGIGDKFGKLRDKANAFADSADRAGEKTKWLAKTIKNLPEKTKIKIEVELALAELAAGNVPKLKRFPGGPSGGPGSLRGRIESGAKKKSRQWALDHLDEIAPLMGAPGNAPGTLGKLEDLGHRMGLYTSSGYRPGDPGFHGQDRARDLAGAPDRMLAYARMLYSQFGTAINELIHTPLGVGIDAHRAGRLTSLYPASTLADHYDHVHVAMQRGGMVPGYMGGGEVKHFNKFRWLKGQPSVGWSTKRLHRWMDKHPKQAMEFYRWYRKHIDETHYLEDAPTHPAQRGWMVPGQGEGDRVPAMLEPGEGVINKRAVKAMGGGGAIAAINAAMPRFQDGGVIGFASGGTVARAAQTAGFRGANLVRAVAEAKGESGWNERAVGDGGWSKGLMQIYTKVHTWARNLNLFDPVVNMKAAKKIWDWQGWGAWHADHLPHVAAAKAAVDAIRSKSKKPPTKPKPGKKGRKGTLNRKPYGGIGRGGILDAFMQHASDRLNMATALAELTPDLADDIAVARDAVATWGTWLNVAKLNNIPAGITSAAQNLKSARDNLAGLTAPAAADTSVADAAAAAASERASIRSGLLEQLLREANQRTAVSQAQYGALKYGGQFADGGIVPGPLGSARMIVAHGGETVTPAGAGGVQVVINGDIINTPRGKQPVEVRDIRVRQRALPGRGGGG